APAAPSAVAVHEPPAIPAAPTGTRVRVHSFAGNVTVQGVPGIHEPVVRSGEGVQVERDGNSFNVSATRRMDNPTELQWLDTVFKALGRVIPTDIVLDVPADLAVLDVRAMAGNVRVRGVHGRLELEAVAGNVDVRDAEEFQVKSTAGNVDVAGRLRSGRSTASSQAGNATVHLEAGSSVRLDARSTVGNATVTGFRITRAEKGITGQSLEGVLGEGTAYLDVRSTAGNVTVTTEAVAL
ncbi:MAG TPA: DUF4097 family beta strand repeat-containing protein, partial [Deinococcales bacterium]|nr:DUF4097 family beta strand repeat-containing protein [Deinococcales bacterium]